MDGRQAWRTSSRRRSTRPSGTPPCNGMRVPAGNEPVPGPRAPGRKRRPQPVTSSRPRSSGSRRASASPGTSSATARRPIRGGFGLFYKRERVSPAWASARTRRSPAPPTSPARSTRRARRPGDAAPGYGAPCNALEQVAANSNYWQWNVAFQQELVQEHRARAGLRGQQGPGPLRPDQPERGRRRRTAWPTRRPATRRSGPLNGIAGIGNGNLALWQHNRDSIYHGLQVALTSRFGHGSVSRSRTPCPS